MYDDIFEEIQKKVYFARYRKVLIIVSSGVDSMNLLHFLYIYRDKLEIEIGITCISYKQRQKSEMEETYPCEWTGKYQIPIYVDYFSGVFSEKAARDFRYQFFKKIMVEKNYIVVVTTYYTGSQAEMISIRFLRDSRLRHLSGT